MADTDLVVIGTPVFNNWFSKVFHRFPMQIIRHSSATFGQLQLLKVFSIIFRCLISWNSGDPVAGLPLAGRAISRSVNSCICCWINVQAPILAGSSCVHNISVVLVYLAMICLAWFSGNGCSCSIRKSWSKGENNRHWKSKKTIHTTGRKFR